MNAEIVIAPSARPPTKLQGIVLLAGVIACAVLVITVFVGVEHQSQRAHPRPTIYEIDPCQPWKLGSQLSTSVEMELEERCAQQENSMPAQ